MKSHSQIPSSNSKSNSLTPTLMLAVFVVAVGGFIFGFDTAVISGVNSAIKEVYGLSSGLQGFTVASALIGTIIGAAAAGWFGDKYGRRDSLKVTGLFFFVSAIGCAFAWDWYSFVASRFIGGLGIGCSSVLAPTYIAELAPAKYRGRMVAMFQMNLVLGILCAYVSNWIIGGLGFDMGVEWRSKLGVAAVPSLLFWVALYFVPRSPRWLTYKGFYSEALDTLEKIGEENPKAELDIIKSSLVVSHTSRGARMFQKKYMFPIFLAFTIAAFNQLTGINGVLYYINDIFEAAHFDKSSSDFNAVCVGATNMIFTILAMTIIDKFGRKFLLLVGSVTFTICLSSVAWIFHVDAHHFWLLPLLMGIVASHAFSQGAVIWVYLSEFFPTALRAKGQGLGSFTHWVFAAAISFAFPQVAEISKAAPFAFFASMMALQFFVVLFIFPETKNVPLEEIQKKLGIDDEA